MKELFGSFDEWQEYQASFRGRKLFRGHSTAKHPLLPSIGRGHSRYSPNLNLETDLLAQFRLKSGPFAHPPDSQLGWIILGRHYGLKTRLLDWTSNPYVALYFALSGIQEAECFPISLYVAHDPPVASYYDIKDNPFDLKGTVFFEPPHLDGRVTAQQSYMSLHHRPLEPFDGDYIERFLIRPDRNALRKMKDVLLSIGIRHGTIYPGLDGVCRDINDNPTGFPEELILEASACLPWRRIPDAWMARPWPETRKRLFEERRFAEFLNFRCDAMIIGLPLEEDGNQLGCTHPAARKLRQQRLPPLPAHSHSPTPIHFQNLIFQTQRCHGPSL